MDKELLPHQQCVIDEKKELDIKIKNLSAVLVEFVSDKEEDEAARELFTAQFRAMKKYSTILGIRIENFK